MTSDGMLESVNDAMKKEVRMLVMDTCGEGAGVAVSTEGVVTAREELSRGSGSAEIVDAVQRVLARAGCSLQEMTAIGVVSGPGSFTGVRVGMAAGKGLSEAAQVRMVTVSRLAVLWEAAAAEGFVALDAGRGECYVRDADGREWLATTEEVRAAAGGREVVVAEERVAERLREAGVAVRLRELSVGDAVAPLVRVAAEDGSMTLGDANYVRRESDIYKGKGVGSRE
jgi:tRNA threonylcarbamoyladenosine biosynthesis protein TsaB